MKKVKRKAVLLLLVKHILVSVQNFIAEHMGGDGRSQRTGM